MLFAQDPTLTVRLTSTTQIRSHERVSASFNLGHLWIDQRPMVLLLSPKSTRWLSTAHQRRSIAGGRAIRRPDAPNLNLAGAKPRQCDGEHGMEILTRDWRSSELVHGSGRVCDMNRAPVRDSWFLDSHQSPEMRCVSSPSYGAAVGFSHHLDSHSPHDGAAAKLEQGRWPGLRGWAGIPENMDGTSEDGKGGGRDMFLYTKERSEVVRLARILRGICSLICWALPANERGRRPHEPGVFCRARSADSVASHESESQSGDRRHPRPGVHGWVAQGAHASVALDAISTTVCLSLTEMATREIELTVWGPHVIDAKGKVRRGLRGSDQLGWVWGNRPRCGP
jgi:hypothetical protein